MEFSVVVPFLNEEVYIERCIKSLLNQSGSFKYEIIFVDNGSTDKSIEIVKKYSKINLLFEKKSNVYAARNLGLAKAKGKIIVFTDADCELNKNFLKNASIAMRETGVAVLLGKRVFPINGLLRYFSDYENEKTDYILINLPTEFAMGFTNNMTVRLEVIRKLEGFRLLKVNGDTDLIQRILNKKLGKAQYSNNMIINHLEVTNILVWLRKQRLYGFHNKTLSFSTKYRGLSLAHNIDIFRSMAKKNSYSIAAIFIALCTLFLGLIAYRLGELETKITT